LQDFTLQSVGELQKTFKKLKKILQSGPVQVSARGGPATCSHPPAVG
jgi:hypothetical protein